MYTIENVTIRIPHLTRPYTFYHISDAHVCAAAPEDPAIVQEFVAEHKSATAVDGVTTNDSFEAMLRYLSGLECDGIFLTGDGVDYSSRGNALYIREIIAACPHKVYYVPGNHEGNPNEYDMFSPVFGENPFQWAEDFGEFLLVGINNSGHMFRDPAYEFVQEQAARNLPILMLMHMPITSASLEEELSRRVDPKEWHYYGMNHKKTGANGLRLVHFLEDPASNVTAVFAGHTHFPHTGPLLGGATQYVADSIAHGYIRCVRLINQE